MIENMIFIMGGQIIGNPSDIPVRLCRPRGVSLEAFAACESVIVVSRHLGRWVGVNIKLVYAHVKNQTPDLLPAERWYQEKLGLPFVRGYQRAAELGLLEIQGGFALPTQKLADMARPCT